MTSPAVALSVFERWKADGRALRVFTPMDVGRASVAEVKVLSVDSQSGKVELFLLDDKRSTVWPISSALEIEYVDSAEDEGAPEELKRDFAGRFLKLTFSPTELFVIGELSN